MTEVPHLTTALRGPLEQIEEHILGHQAAIESWLRSQWHESPPPFYTSIDLRNAGFKLAPVDTNLFPAGFNNLNPEFLPLGVQAIQSAVDQVLPSALRVLIIAESHTRNLPYMENLASLTEMFQKAGLEVRIGSFAEELKSPRDVDLPSGRTVRLEPVVRQGTRVGVGDFSPCLLLLNNDMSSGPPAALQGIEQIIVPPLALGWAHRLKSDHFREYALVAKEFAALVEIDPWLIDPLFRNCGQIDFMKRDGEECLADNVDALLAMIREKYREYGVTKEPFVIVKADAGTYGMAVMTVKSAAEVHDLNRKQRTRMAKTKGGVHVSKVIVQEGVYTMETWGDAAIAEPVVYMVDRHVVGGFYRVHTGRSSNENLNAPGMRFEPLAFAQTCILPDQGQAPDAEPNRFYAYGVIARLATLAAARELAPGPRPEEECSDDTTRQAGAA